MTIEDDDSAALAATGEAVRLAEIDGLTADIRRMLEEMAHHMKAGDGFRPVDVLKKLGELQSAHLKALEMEKAFNDKLGRDDADAYDFDAIRDQIGERLDRIRASLGAEEVSGGTG